MQSLQKRLPTMILLIWVFSSIVAAQVFVPRAFPVPVLSKKSFDFKNTSSSILTESSRSSHSSTLVTSADTSTITSRATISKSETSEAGLMPLEKGGTTYSIDWVYANNTCTQTSAIDSGHYLIDWKPCWVTANTVHLSYWPTNGNFTYPKTYYDAALSFTFTSPSVYMVAETVYGYNSCGRIGQALSSQIMAFDLTEISTYQPYADATATTRMGPERQLTLDDFANCPSQTASATAGTHPLDDSTYRCNPRLDMSDGNALKDLGMPYWVHCNDAYLKGGLFDPPGAIPVADDGLFGIISSSSTLVKSVPPTTASAAPAGTVVKSEASSTTSPVSAIPTSASRSDSADSTTVAAPSGGLPANPNSETSVTDPASSSHVAVVVTTSISVASAGGDTSANLGSGPLAATSSTIQDLTNPESMSKETAESSVPAANSPSVASDSTIRISQQRQFSTTT